MPSGPRPAQPAEGIDVLPNQKWGTNSDIHITSSTLDYRNSQLAEIAGVTTTANAATLALSAGIDAVLSENETPGMGVEVALLTRNIKIEGEYIADVTTDRQGGYLQVLHTPGVAQVLEGVEFVRMGQRDIKNRYPIQLLYVEDVSGTSIARNSIRYSNNGCVRLDGVSGATVSSNVAYGSLRNDCFYVGYEATDNLVAGNLASYVRSHDAFQIDNPSNDFVGNVAAGTYGRG